MRRAFILSGLLVLAVGCAPPRPEPRLVADRVFRGDFVRFTVAPYAHDREHRSRIADVQVRDARGRQLHIPLVMDLSPQTPLAGQTVALALLPPMPPRLRVVLAVIHGPWAYVMEIPLDQQDEHDWPRWIRGDPRTTCLGRVPTR